MSSHKYIYVGPYLKLPRLTKRPWLDSDRLYCVECGSLFDTWIANVGKYDLYPGDDYGEAVKPCPITTDMMAIEPFTEAFADLIGTLRELYGCKGVIEFGIVTYWS